MAGNRPHNWLWMAIEPATKIIPVIHLGMRGTEDAYRFICGLSLRVGVPDPKRCYLQRSPAMAADPTDHV